MRQSVHSQSYWYFGIKTSNIFDEKWLHFHIGSSTVRMHLSLMDQEGYTEKSHNRCYEPRMNEVEEL